MVRLILITEAQFEYGDMRNHQSRTRSIESFVSYAARVDLALPPGSVIQQKCIEITEYTQAVYVEYSWKSVLYVHVAVLVPGGQCIPEQSERSTNDVELEELGRAIAEEEEMEDDPDEKI